MLFQNTTTANVHFLSRWDTHVNSFVEENDEYHTDLFRYEDFLTDPEEAFTEVLHAMGFPEVDASRLDFALEATTFDKFKKREEEDEFAERGKQDRFFARGTSGGYRQHLVGAQIEQIENTFRETMVKWGYLDGEKHECVEDSGNRVFERVG